MVRRQNVRSCHANLSQTVSRFTGGQWRYPPGSEGHSKQKWQQWQQGGPSPRERAVQLAAVSSGVFIAAALLFPASPPLCLCPQHGRAAGSFWKPSSSLCPWRLTSQWQDRGPGLVGGHCVLLSDINHKGFLAWLAWAHVACGLEGPVFWGATLLPTYCY